MIKTWHLVSGIVLISIITVLLQLPSGTWTTSATVSLIAGLIVLACMAVARILSSRWNFIEGIFGGLDRMYETHKWLGVWALIFASYHVIFKAKLGIWDIEPILDLPQYWTRMIRQLIIVAL